MEGMKKIGITGAIGAGKSFASSLLRGRGYAVLDADAKVHELYRDCKDLREELEAAFGPECLTAGGVDRKFFAGLIFGDARARERLEGIVYPYLTQAVRAFFDSPSGSVTGIEPPAGQSRFLEAALLSRVPEIVGMLDEIWIVDAPEGERLRRLEARGLEREDALRRIQDQRGAFDESLFPGIRVRVLENAGDKSALERVVDSLLGGTV